MVKLKSEYILIIIALVFHIIGLVGIGILGNAKILAMTPYHLLLMSLLLILSFFTQIKRFAIWAAVTIIIGYTVEWVGVHTGMLFGHYSYSSVLGPKVSDVPLLIGANWMMVVAGSVCVAHIFTKKKDGAAVIAAFIATGYDFLMEGVAIKLDYWQWEGHVIPYYNYICWWAVSFCLAYLWKSLQLRDNLFSICLLVMQISFFLILRVLL